MKKNDWDAFAALLMIVLAVFAILEFFRNDRNQLISARGRAVLNDPALMKKVSAQLAEHEKKGVSGPVVVNLH
ncbi:MAG: hypothetical protein IPH60_14910 [Flavobacteriales bacterium]|nr:hypothetical protein [Flavobacteriales bacterium]